MASRRPIKIRIDLKKVNQSLCYRSDRTGAVYLDLVAWEVDESRYGETHRVSQDEPKDYDGERLPICGNLTDPDKAEPQDDRRGGDRRDDRRDDRRGDRREDRQPERDRHGRDRSGYRGQGGHDGDGRDDHRRRDDRRDDHGRYDIPREAARPACRQEPEPRETARSGNYGKERPIQSLERDDIPF